MKTRIKTFMTSLLCLSIILTGCTSSGSNQDEVIAEDEQENEFIQTSTAKGASNIVIYNEDNNHNELSSSTILMTIGNKEVTLSGAYVIDGIEVTIEGGSYQSNESDQNVFLVINGGHLTISNAQITKTSDASTSDSKRTSDVSDDYNFYGINSVILVVGEDSSATITDCVIASNASGANAIFSTDGANIITSNVEISTTGNSSRGVYATYGGTIAASNMTISTVGSHCASIATDRGGGYVMVKDSIVSTEGSGSPCIYSTGEIVVNNVTGTALKSQAAVIEGKNSVTMINSEFTTTNGNNGAMLYQSGSGDASDKDATTTYSTLTLENSTINVLSDGPMFYITNTTSIINLNGENTLTTTSNFFVNAAIGRWGKDGRNGGNVTLNIFGYDVTESLVADDISSIIVNFNSGSFTGESTGDVTING